MLIVDVLRCSRTEEKLETNHSGKTTPWKCTRLPYMCSARVVETDTTINLIIAKCKNSRCLSDYCSFCVFKVNKAYPKTFYALPTNRLLEPEGNHHIVLVRIQSVRNNTGNSFENMTILIFKRIFLGPFLNCVENRFK